MRRAARCALLCCAAALAAAPAADQLLGNVQADVAKTRPLGGENNGLWEHELIGSVHVTVSRIGERGGEATVDADKLTVISGPGPNGQETVLKMFAAGSIHIVGSAENRAKATTYSFDLRCERLDYSAKDQMLHFYAADGGWITGTGVIRTEPTEENELEAPSVSTLDIKTKTYDVSLAAPAPEAEAGPMP